MFRVIQKCIVQHRNKGNFMLQNVRTFLSQAYYCQEIWDRRLDSPIIQKVNIDEFFFELDQRYQRTRELSAVDVDILVNAIKDNQYMDELLDITHKLRLTAETCNTLSSTNHATIRTLMQFDNMENVANILDDRLNYGLFLDYYTANILMDICWKKKDYTSGARLASQLMLQEECDHPISNSLSLLHCYKYLVKPEGWPQYPQAEEPEDEVKIRVRFLRNPFDDEHFDLRDPNKIVGKTFMMFTKGKDDPLSKSLNILGGTLFGKVDKVKLIIEECNTKSLPLVKNVLDLIPPESEIKNLTNSLIMEPTDAETLLIENVKKAIHLVSERDIADQCKYFIQWEEERLKALEIQKERLAKARRLKKIEDIQKELKEKETRLWFFDNEENIELTIEESESVVVKDNKVVQDTNSDIYIPPEITKKQNV